MNMVRIAVLTGRKVVLEDFMTDDLDKEGTLSTTRRGNLNRDTPKSPKTAAALVG